jgi:molecular chaperone HtpG
MVEGQDTMWYLTDVDKDRIASKPVLEGFKRRDWEVILMTDPVDEWVVMSLKDFDEVPLQSAAHGELPEEDETERSEEEEQARSAATPLASWMGEMLSTDVAEVRLSSRLTDSPSVLVNKQGSMGANMENILKAANQEIFQDKRVLEINPEHPMVQTLARLNTEGQPGLEPFARLLLDHAQIAEGRVADPAGFAGRLQALMEKAASSF